jgi:hypothetical protein
MVSPLVSTPIDISFTHLRLNTEFKTTRDDSPRSPLHLALDTKLPESPSISSISSSQQSFATSPQDLDWDDPVHEDILSLRLPDSPVSDAHTSSPLATPSVSYRALEGDSEKILSDCQYTPDVKLSQPQAAPKNSLDASTHLGTTSTPRAPLSTKHRLHPMSSMRLGILRNPKTHHRSGCIADCADQNLAKT